MSRNYQRPAYRTPAQPAYGNIRRQPSVESFRSAVPSPFIRNPSNAPSVASNTDYYRKEPVSRPNSTVYGYQNERPTDRPMSYLGYYGSNQYDRPDRPPSARTEFEEPNINPRRGYKTRSALNLKPSFTSTSSYQREQREPYRDSYINGSYQPHSSTQSQYDGYYPSQREAQTYNSGKPYSQPYATSNNPPPPPSSTNQYQQNLPSAYNQSNYQDLNYRRPSQDEHATYREPSEITTPANYRNESVRINQPNPGYQTVNPPQNGGYSSPGYRNDGGPPLTAGYRNDAGPPSTGGYRNETGASGPVYRNEAISTSGGYRGDQPASNNYSGYQPEKSPIYESAPDGRQYEAFRKQKEEKQQLPESLRQNSKKVESMLSHARSGSDVTKQKQESLDFINLQALSVKDPALDTLKQIYNLSREMAALVLERSTPLTQEEWDSLVEKIQLQSHLVSSIDSI